MREFLVAQITENHIAGSVSMNHRGGALAECFPLGEDVLGFGIKSGHILICFLDSTEAPIDFIHGAQEIIIQMLKFDDLRFIAIADIVVIQ